MGTGGRVRLTVRYGGSGGGSGRGSGVPSLLRLEPVGDSFYLLSGVVPGELTRQVAPRVAADGVGRKAGRSNGHTVMFVCCETTDGAGTVVLGQRGVAGVLGVI